MYCQEHYLNIYYRRCLLATLSLSIRRIFLFFRKIFFLYRCQSMSYVLLDVVKFYVRHGTLKYSDSTSESFNFKYFFFYILWSHILLWIYEWYHYPTSLYPARDATITMPTRIRTIIQRTGPQLAYSPTDY